MHPPHCRCVVCLVDRSSFGTPEAKAARESVSDEQAARVVARAKAIELVAANPRGIPEGPAAIHFCPVPGCLDIWESEATCEHAALIPDEERTA